MQTDQASATPEVMQSERWREDLGDKWLRWLPQFEGMIATVGQALLEHAAFQPGERVLDIGCGGGATSLDIAGRVGDSGQVTGVDVNASLVRTAEQRQQQAGLSQLQFQVGDAGSLSLSSPVDHLFSRFGVMFFEAPVAAFGHLHAQLREGGRMTFACWGPPAENPWVGEFMAIVGRYVPLTPPAPHAPGPFAFADLDYLRSVLDEAGFTAVDIQRWTGPQYIGGRGASVEQAADFLLDATFVGEAVQDCDAGTRAAVREEVVAALARCDEGEGPVLPGMAWLVRARY